MVTAETIATQAAVSTAPCLRPINVNSKLEKELFYDQRVLCGWKSEVVDQIFDQIRRGERIVYWVCIPSQHDIWVNVVDGRTVVSDNQHEPARATQDNDHSEQKASKSTIHIPLLCGKQSAVVNHAHPPVENATVTKTQLAPLLPVGHISIDTRDFDIIKTPLLGASDGRVLSISTLFILTDYRKLGLARWSMDECERLIRSGVDFSSASSSSRDSSGSGSGSGSNSTTRGEGGGDGVDNDKTRNTSVLTIPTTTTTPTPTQVVTCEAIALSCLSERHHVADGPGGTDFWVANGMEFLVRRNGSRTRYLGTWYKSLGYERVHEMGKYEEINHRGKEFVWYGEIWMKRLV